LEWRPRPTPGCSAIEEKEEEDIINGGFFIAEKEHVYELGTEVFYQIQRNICLLRPCL
jgi:hypothetical protein